MAQLEQESLTLSRRACHNIASHTFVGHIFLRLSGFSGHMEGFNLMPEPITAVPKAFSRPFVDNGLGLGPESLCDKLPACLATCLGVRRHVTRRVKASVNKH